MPLVVCPHCSTTSFIQEVVEEDKDSHIPRQEQVVLDCGHTLYWDEDSQSWT